MNPKDIQKEYINKLKPQNPAVKFRDGRLSIQASSYNYCHPKHDHGPYTCFEVAYLIGDGINNPEPQSIIHENIVEIKPIRERTIVGDEKPWRTDNKKYRE